MDTFTLKGSVAEGMTDEEFLRFCLENPDLRIERNSDREIIIISPVTSIYSQFGAEISGQLRDWNRKMGRGVVFDSSAGFTLPDRSVLSPDASWISKAKWSALSDEDKEKFAPICPEFIIEVRSKSDDLTELTRKMQAWIKNGARLGWLIDPREEVSYIFRPDESRETVKGFNKILSGEGPVAGFELDLSLIKT